MATITKFEDIVAWQKARVLCQRIFIIINEGDFARDFKVRDQINASSGSVIATEYRGLKFKEPEPVYGVQHDNKLALPAEINELSYSEESH